MSVGILSDDEKIATSLAAPRNDADMKNGCDSFGSQPLIFLLSLIFLPNIYLICIVIFTNCFNSIGVK